MAIMLQQLVIEPTGIQLKSMSGHRANPASEVRQPKLFDSVLVPCSKLRGDSLLSLGVPRILLLVRPTWVSVEKE